MNTSNHQPSNACRTPMMSEANPRLAPFPSGEGGERSETGEGAAVRAIPSALYALPLLALTLLLTTPTLAQRNLTDIPDPSPQLELAALKPAPGFQINLYATDPQINKPIQMNFDAAGRLWVVGSSVYPQIKPGQEATDKIYILEDTDNDGVAETSTVFYDQLLMPTGIEPDDTVPHLAAYVANTTELLYLEDTDGDKVADKSTVVYSGFGSEDTHHIIHTFRWGPAGHLYFNQSIYIHSHIETPYGPRRLLGGGIWQLHPDTKQLEVFTHGMYNTWGHHFNDWGQSFQTDGADGNGINYAFPGAAYAAAVGAERFLPGLNPGQPKQASLEFITGRHIPERWQGRLITHDFRGNRVNSFQLAESGSGYVSRQGEDLITTTHVAFRPIDVKMGPDGAIYIADWYNPIIQHGEVDFRDPRRDTTHGRIWRVTATDRPLTPKPNLENATIPQLLDYLKAPEQFTRQKAKQLLKRHGADAVLPQLDRWVRTLNTSDPNHNRNLLEALWAYHWLGAPNTDLTLRLLNSEDHHLRAAAIRTINYPNQSLPSTIDLLAPFTNDPHPQVRLEAVNALRQINTTHAALHASTALNHQPLDTNLDFALDLTLRQTAPLWLPEVQKDPTILGPPANLLYALKTVNDTAALQPLLTLYRNGFIPADQQQSALDLIAQLGGPAELRILFDLALTLPAENPSRPGILNALTRAASNRQLRPSGDLAELNRLITSFDLETTAAAASLAGALKHEPAVPALTRLATSTSIPRNVADSATRSLAAINNEPARKTLTQLTTEPPSPAHLLAALSALASTDPNAAAPTAAQLLTQLEPAANPAPYIQPFLSSERGPRALAQALNNAALESSVASAALRLVSSSGRDLPQLSAAIAKAGNLQLLTSMPQGPELAAIIQSVQTSGNPQRGEQIYRQQQLLCMNCHAIAGAGGKVGPDLSSIGASAPTDYIIESLLNPQAKIKEGYHTTQIALTTGNIAAGVVLQETPTELILRDASDTETRIQKSQVASSTIVPLSLMPPGLTTQLSTDQFVDLVAFLSQLGKEGGITIPRNRLIRTYQMMEGGGPISGTIRAKGVNYVARPDSTDLTWRTLYTHVDGSLPLADFPDTPSAIYYFGGAQFRATRFQLNVTQPGNVTLKLNNPDTIQLYHDENIIAPVTEQTTFQLPAGLQTITVITNSNERGQTPLKIELLDPPSNPAQVDPVNDD